MNTQIFAYKGVVGAVSDLEQGKFMNGPPWKNQLGIVCEASTVDITPEAVELIRNAKREGGSFAPIMLTHTIDDSYSIGLLGGYKHVFQGKDLTIGRDCDLSVLDKLNVIEDMEIPQGFKDIIDNPG